MVHRPNHGEALDTGRQARQVFAETDTGQLGLYRAVFASNAIRRVRLRIKRLVLRWTAGLKNEDDRLGAFAARRWRGLRLKTEQVAEASSDQAERADLK
jgi:hypothetical protein